LFPPRRPIQSSYLPFGLTQDLLAHNMSAFLHPALLWFLPLAAIPLLLHLLTLHRLKTVELSTFRFLFDSYVQQRRRMRFLEALLAMLRTAFLLVLVFMAARPVVQHWSQLFGADKGSSREVILLMDCSASMKASTAGLSAFDRAKKAARAVVDRLGRDDRVTLIRVTTSPEELFSRYTTDVKDIHKRIDELKPTPARANLFATLLHLFGPEAAKRHNPVVYLFTDCQASGWREARSQGLDRIVPAGTPFFVVNVGSRDSLANRAVLGDAPERSRAIAGLPLVLQPRVVSFSKAEQADLTLSVFMEDKQIDRSPLPLKPQETANPQVRYLPTRAGLQRGRFEIAGATPDRFPDDDSFFFTLFVEERVKVLVVGNTSGDDPEVNEARYLATALTSQADAPAAENGADREAEKILRSLEVTELAEAALTPAALEDASVVVLANCGALDAARMDLLRGFVRQGGGLLIFPGDKVNPDQYNQELFPVPGPQNEELTPARLGPAIGDPNRADTFERLATLDFSHPALSVFEDADSAVRPFSTVRIYRHYPLQVPGKGRGARPLAWFGSGAPALVESRLGDGLVVLSSFPAHTRWTNLPTRPNFVPLVLRLVSHVEHRPEVEVTSTVSAGSPTEISVSSTWAPAEATVRGPGGQTQTVPLQRAGSRLRGAFTQTSQVGVYTVEVRGKQGARPRAARLGFAVNIAPEESDFTLLDEPALRALLPMAQLTYVDASAEAQLDNGALGRGHEVWQVLIWGLFALIGVEFFFATLSGKRREGEETPSVGERILQLTPGAWVGRMTGASSEEKS
jgi:hypothetical protein